MTVIDVRKPWHRLDEQLQRAVAYPLAILVWGPAPGDSLGARKRAEIRDALNAAGHSARFSEDLIAADSPLTTLDQELLQADSADLIVVLYVGRGVQTEVDTLLSKRPFASKAVILIQDTTYRAVMTSVAAETWKQLSRFATELVEYTAEELERCEVVARACDIAHRARAAAYVAARSKEL